MRRKEINFREQVVIWMPYILLKFLVKEKLLTKFLNECEQHYLDNKEYEFTEYLLHLEYIYTKTHLISLKISEKKRLYKICFRDAFTFNNYWYRRFWKFEEFLDDYEKYIE